ncbi:DUF7282 domain-containing protein [Halorussus caseinilyticus]|uniref:DUF7282 domain-containing protein n=1 Tax=Halorussus caseinilyticus TaxID=3034025 RepID=A0ABD5WHV3_9EURY|nr:hypothetical protein [Halorussus sp. DT72]
MTRKTIVLAVVALLLAGTSAALAAGTGPTETSATDGVPMAQETTTAGGNQTTQTTTAETTAEGTAQTTQTPTGQATASVIFLNQSAGFSFTDGAPNTTTVTLERVVVPEGGFLVIHEARNVSGDYASAENVSVGPVVGNSTYLEPGVHSNVVVELDGSINDSQTLVAMPHLDTNDNQRYDFPEADDPYVMDGSPVVETAYVIVEYDVIDATFGEQTTANETTTA